MDNVEQQVRSVWPDADPTAAYAMQKDGTKKWMWCIMSNTKFQRSRGKNKVLNIGEWCYSEAAAWESAWEKSSTAKKP